MNEGCDNTATWTGGEKKRELFYFETEDQIVGVWSFNFQKDAGRVANQQATGFDF